MPTEILLGNAVFVERAPAIPIHEQAVPIIVVEEIVRGRLNVIRQAEARKSSVSIEHAYELFEETFSDFRRIKVLLYTSQSESVYQQWRRQKIRVSTHDLRIAAICISHSVKLISRNRKDFECISSLMVKFWD